MEAVDLVGTTIAAYRIVARLGVGGMGSVYRAEQAPLGRPVALKVIHDHLAQDPAVAARFLREAKIASSLRNPNTVTVYDFGQAGDGRLYMAMELLEGQTLSSRIERAGALSPEMAIAVGVQICRSLSEAHGKTIVHRDLKSDNVFLGTADDGSMLVTVLDYGIAHAGSGHASPGGPSRTPEPLTQHGMVVGTPSYMAPEQARGEPVDARADLYALGVILYEMLTGARPFRADSPVGILAKVLTDPPPPMASTGVRRAPPPALEEVVLALMEKDRALRPPTALAVQSRLRAASAAAGGKGDVPSEPELQGPWGLPTELRPSSPPPTSAQQQETVALKSPPPTSPPKATPAPAAPALQIDADASPFEVDVGPAPARLEVDRSVPVELDMPLAAMRRRSTVPPPRPSSPPRRPSRPSPVEDDAGSGAKWVLAFGLVAAIGGGVWWWRGHRQAPPPTEAASDAGAAIDAPALPPPPAEMDERAASAAGLARQEEALRADGFAPAALPAGGWNGSYDLDGGVLTLFEQDGRITGTFDSALRAGRIEGALAADGLLEFDWRSTDSGAVRASQVRTGRGRLQSFRKPGRSDERRLSGSWGFGDSRDGALWLAVPRTTGRAAPGGRPRRPGR